MDSSQVLKIMALLSRICLLLSHPTSWRTYHPVFLPGPQFCPDTGRTVCAAVDYYPTDQIYHLLTSAKSQIFNLTSLFVDERKGDVEPNLAQIPTQPPHYRDGYGGSQPPPGGRFSPAGYNNWSPATSEKPQNYPDPQNDHWRQVSQINNNNGQYGNGASRAALDNGSRRQSRAQNLSNQRRNINYRRHSVGTPPKHSYDVQTKYNEPNDNYRDYNNYGVTQHNAIEQHHLNHRFNNHYVQKLNFSGFHPQDIERSQEPYQIQPPFNPHNVKGQGFYPVMTMRPQIDGNWKGSPSRHEYSRTPSSGLLQREPPMHSTFNRRERRNRDVEVACQVQSRYVPPRAALGDNSEWRYIINVPERDRRFSQVVRVDVCLNEGQPCSSRLSLPFGFESRCRQKYIKKKLLSLNADGQGTSEGNFFVPSCCVCEITRPNLKKKKKK